MTKREMMTRDYLSGMSMREVAARYGRTLGGLQTSFSTWGVRLTADERKARRQAVMQKARGARRTFRSVWPDCPPEKQEDYRTLRKFYNAAEARAMLEVV